MLENSQLLLYIIISGYVAEEKLVIAQQYLLPQVSEITGLKIDDSIVVEEAALSKLIKSYCRESGVRNLRKHIEKIFRKAAFLNVSEGQTGITISKSNLQDFVGKPVFSQGMYNFGKGLKGGLVSGGIL